jgi:hypothetical protein
VRFIAGFDNFGLCNLDGLSFGAPKQRQQTPRDIMPNTE